RRFELDPLPYELPGVLAKGKQPLASRRYADFERRRHSGMGSFLTQEQCERLHPTTLVDVLATVHVAQQMCVDNDCVPMTVPSLVASLQHRRRSLRVDPDRMAPKIQGELSRRRIDLDRLGFPVGHVTVDTVG